MLPNSNYNVIKEPRGFIKCLEVFLAIFAFSCATGFRGTFKLSQTPLKLTQPIHPVEGSFKYPFDGSISVKMATFPNITNMQDVSISIDERSSTEFFVVVGVFCFLYSLVVLIYYIFFEEKSTTTPPTSTTFTPPVIDFVVGGVWAFFWFVSACAQAAAVNSIKDATNAKDLSTSLLYCKDPFKCTVVHSAKYATLTISILLGFLNVFVWAGNMWFLWKETPWFRNRQGGNQAATVPPPQQHQQTPTAAAI